LSVADENNLKMFKKLEKNKKVLDKVGKQWYNEFCC